MNRKEIGYSTFCEAPFPPPPPPRVLHNNLLNFEAAFF